MAEETSTSNTSPETIEGFDPEDLEVPGKSTSTSTKTEETPEPEEDDDVDFDPAAEEFEIPSPKKDEEPAEKKGGDEEQDSSKSSKSKEVKPSDRSEEKPELKAPTPPITPKLVKVKIGEDEYEFPEESYDAISNTVTAAKEIQEKSAELSKNLLEKHSETYLDLLTDLYKGDRDKAFQHMIQEYAEVIKAEIERQSLPPEQREAMAAKEKAQRLETELKQYREKEEAEKKKIAEAREIESFMGEIVNSMKDMKLDLNDKYIKDIAFETLDNLKLLRSQGKNPVVSDVVKYVKTESDKRLAEKDKQYEESLADLPDEELLKRHQKLVERLRKTDLAQHKAAVTAKTAPKPTDGAERESQSSKKKVLNSADWDKHWFGK